MRAHSTFRKRDGLPATEAPTILRPVAGKGAGMGGAGIQEATVQAHSIMDKRLLKAGRPHEAGASYGIQLEDLIANNLGNIEPCGSSAANGDGTINDGANAGGSVIVVCEDFNLPTGGVIDLTAGSTQHTQGNNGPGWSANGTLYVICKNAILAGTVNASGTATDGGIVILYTGTLTTTDAYTPVRSVHQAN